MALAAYDAEDRAEQLLGLTERLNGLVLQEIADLDARKLDASSRDWAEKEKLAQAYRVEMARISADPTLLEGASPAVKQRLADATKAFQAQLDRHAVALGVMKDISEGLVRSIAEEMSEQKAAPAGYGATGTGAKRTGSTGLAINAKA